MNWNLISSNGCCSVHCNDIEQQSQVTISSELGFEADVYKFEFSFMHTSSASDLLSCFRVLLNDVRDRLLDGKKSSRKIDLVGGSFIISPYDGDEIIDQLAKQWFEISVRNQPTIHYTTLLLLDITVIDQFMEVNFPN